MKKKNTFLIVDDNKDHRLLLINILKRRGYIIVGEAANGIEALEKYKKLRPALVTMDIRMPESNGLSAIKDIFAFDPTATILVTTMIKENETLMHTVKAIVSDYIVKPFNEEQVLQAVKNALED